jgi:hypothetical protein
MSHNRHLLPRQEVWIHKDSLPNECGLRRLEDEEKSGKLGFFAKIAGFDTWTSQRVQGPNQAGRWRL